MRVLTAGQLRWLRTLLVLIFTAPLVPLATPIDRAMAADPYTIAGEWEITFEIQNSKIRAFWIGSVWEYIDGVEQLTEQMSENISATCQVFGEPIFGESDVTFDGVDDYITCRIPNFQALFGTMDERLANCRCQFTGPPYASANITPDYSTAYQPVVYHRRLQLDVTQLAAKSLRIPFIRKNAEVALRDAVRTESGSGLGQAQLTLHFLDDSVQSWQSNIFSGWQQNGYQIWMGYDAARYVANNSPTGFPQFLVDNGFWEAVLAEHDKGFFRWESEAKASFSEEEMPSGFGLAAGTLIYVGHNPETEEYYKGVIRAVSVDPGCRGH